MIRLTQTELVQEKKEKDSPDDSTPAVKKEAECEPVPPQSTDQAPPGALHDCFNRSKITAPKCIHLLQIKTNAFVYQVTNGGVQTAAMFYEGCFAN